MYRDGVERSMIEAHDVRHEDTLGRTMDPNKSRDQMGTDGGRLGRRQGKAGRELGSKKARPGRVESRVWSENKSKKVDRFLGLRKVEPGGL